MDERKTLKSLDDRDLSTLTTLKLIEAMAWKERNKERKKSGNSYVIGRSRFFNFDNLEVN